MGATDSRRLTPALLATFRPASCVFPLLPVARLLLPLLAAAVVDRDSGVVLEFVEAAVGDDVARVDAVDLRIASVGDAGLSRIAGARTPS